LPIPQDNDKKTEQSGDKKKKKPGQGGVVK